MKLSLEGTPILSLGPAQPPHGLTTGQPFNAVSRNTGMMGMEESDCECSCPHCSAGWMGDEDELDITPAVLSGLLGLPKGSKIVVIEKKDKHAMRFVLKDKQADESCCSLEEAGQELEEGGATTDEGERACEACMYEYMASLDESVIEEAEYRGRKVPLGKPMRGDVKKFKVFVRDPKTGNVKKVNFGDKKMRIKKSNPKRRKSFRARHNCANPGPRTKARYWSCRKW